MCVLPRSLPTCLLMCQLQNDTLTSEGKAAHSSHSSATGGASTT